MASKLSRRVKNLHNKYGLGLSLREFARGSDMATSQLDAVDQEAIAQWLQNKKRPPKQEVTSKYRGDTKGDRRPRGRGRGGWRK